VLDMAKSVADVGRKAAGESCARSAPGRMAAVGLAASCWRLHVNAFIWFALATAACLSAPAHARLIDAADCTCR
jgi:hypothetical protein